MPQPYNHHIASEQIRAIEEQCAPYSLSSEQAAPSSLPATDTDNFDDYLKQRTMLCIAQRQLADSLNQAPKWCSAIISVVIFIAFLSGTAATLKAVSGPQNTLNIFWILVILLGFNVMSLLFWSAITLVPKRQAYTSSTGPAGALFRHILEWVITRTAKKCMQRSANKMWLSLHLGQKQGQWFLGSVTHLSWLFYLLGGIFMLVAVLATQQYNFIWSSTLLGDSTFVSLTQTLATPMAWLHWPTLTLAEISSSQQGADAYSLASTRKAWATFLLGCLFFYGLLPRAIAWLACVLLRRRALKNIKPNLSTPYYQKLQQHWQNSRQRTQILDHELPTVHITQPSNHAFDNKTLPFKAFCLGIELAQTVVEALPQKPSINAIDKTSAGQAIDALKAIDISKTPVLFLVSAKKAPDRGISRLLQSFIAARPDAIFWMVCIYNSPSRNLNTQAHKNNGTDAAPSTKHLLAWQSVANQLAIATHHCALMDLSRGQ